MKTKILLVDDDQNISSLLSRFLQQSNFEVLAANSGPAGLRLAYNEHPDLVKAWLTAHVEVTQWEVANPDQAQKIANDEIKRLTGKALADQVLTGAWARMKVTYDPISSSLFASADSAFAAGFLKQKPDLTNIYDLKLLNEVLAEKGLPAVK